MLGRLQGSSDPIDFAKSITNQNQQIGSHTNKVYTIHMITIIEPDPSTSATTYPILVQLFSVGRGVLVYAWQHYDGWLVYVGSTMSTSGIGDRVCLLCLHVGAAYPCKRFRAAGRIQHSIHGKNKQGTSFCLSSSGDSSRITMYT